MELYASISTRNINFVSFLFSSICKVASTAYDFTQCVYRHHCFRAHFGRATIGKDKLIPFFQAQSAMFCFSFYYCQLELPIFSAPFLHINILHPIVCPLFCFIASFAFVLQRHRAKPMPLFFCVQFIIEPSNGIFINISQMLLVILTVANDMIIGAILPYICSIIFVAKPFESGHEP